MRPLTSLMPLHEAMQILLEEVRPIDDTLALPVERAVGSVLAEVVVSRFDVPPFARAAMDGYAVCAGVTVGANDECPVRLRCLECLYAGSIATQSVRAGVCAEIATGAPMPPGADAVVMVEHTVRDGTDILVKRTVRAGQHVTAQGADMVAGETVADIGTLLTPARVGALAAVGRRDVCVFRRPLVKVGATGNEVAEPGQPLRPGQIYDINSYTLYALFSSIGCEVEMLEPCNDDVRVIEHRIRESLDADMVVLSGGSSVGEKDVLQDSFEELGEILFHGVAIKPGKPTMLARVQGKPVVGLPGYPTSCLSNGYLFLVPALCKMARKPLPNRYKVRVPAAERLTSMADKHQIMTVRVVDGRAFGAFRESGAISSMSRADGFIEIPVGEDAVEVGQEVEVTLL